MVHSSAILHYVKVAIVKVVKMDDLRVAAEMLLSFSQ